MCEFRDVEHGLLPITPKIYGKVKTDTVRSVRYRAALQMSSNASNGNYSKQLFNPINALPLFLDFLIEKEKT